MVMLCETPAYPYSLTYVCRERATHVIGQYTQDYYNGRKGVSLLYVCEEHLTETTDGIKWPSHWWYDFSNVIQGPWERKEGA
jgi:hypothetical protein